MANQVFTFFKTETNYLILLAEKYMRGQLASNPTLSEDSLQTSVTNYVDRLLTFADSGESQDIQDAAKESVNIAINALVAKLYAEISVPNAEISVPNA
jgi:hypothetical protein